MRDLQEASSMKTQGREHNDVGETRASMKPKVSKLELKKSVRIGLEVEPAGWV